MIGWRLQMWIQPSLHLFAAWTSTQAHRPQEELLTARAPTMRLPGHRHPSSASRTHCGGIHRPRHPGSWPTWRTPDGPPQRIGLGAAIPRPPDQPPRAPLPQAPARADASVCRRSPRLSLPPADPQPPAASAWPRTAPVCRCKRSQQRLGPFPPCRRAGQVPEPREHLRQYADPAGVALSAAVRWRISGTSVASAAVVKNPPAPSENAATAASASRTAWASRRASPVASNSASDARAMAA